jgi:hypothetical protein
LPPTLALFINPRTQLIERIEGRHALPDGGECQIELRITPVRAEWAPPVSDAAPTVG